MPGWRCGAPSHNTFSDSKTHIAIEHPVDLNDVPAFQVDCDFHSFAWNQFIYFVQTVDTKSAGAVPRFMTLAPWYNILGKTKPASYPGGDIGLKGGMLDLHQAGSEGVLQDVNGNKVLYDIRFNEPMYAFIKTHELSTEAGFLAQCKPDAKNGGICAKQIWLPPNGGLLVPGALEIKTAWIDFKDKCPSDEYYCNGTFGLVGIHIVQKTNTHGEWIWASFEHAANTPDCAKGGDAPIAAASPAGYPWSFFNPKTVPPEVMSSQSCNVTAKPPQCNWQPTLRALGERLSALQASAPVNVCRTDSLPPGGVANCGGDVAEVQAAQVTPAQRDKQNHALIACLNGSITPLLSGVWKNYKLIGTQWVEWDDGNQKIGGTQDFRIQIFQQAAGSLPYVTPVGTVHMANTTMETWLQTGSTGYDPIGDNATKAGCFNCHNPPSNAGKFPEVDLSHFPVKLPKDRLERYLKVLVPAKVQ